MPLIFLQALIIFTISSLQFHPVKLLRKSPGMSGRQFTESQFTGLTRLAETLEFYHN